jgi:transposase InsO family protein
VLTGNGAVFTAKQRGQGRVALEVELGLRGIRISHSRPYYPQTCGKVCEDLAGRCTESV